MGIEVTISHLFSVADSDVARFQELGVHANFTPHWFGGTAYGDAREINVGPERAGRSQLVGQFMRQGVNVTLSSDVVYNALRVSPFIGVEMSMTRRALGRADAPTMPPRDARISLEQALAGYTVNGAAQLGRQGQIGVIRAGLLADFIVLPQDPFEMDVERIHTIAPSATVVGGELRSGSLLWDMPPYSTPQAPNSDFDGDGTVDLADFFRFAEQFGSSQGDKGYEARYDLDGDDIIGLGDFFIFANDFGKEASSN